MYRFLKVQLIKNTKKLVILGAGESGTGAALLAKAKGIDQDIPTIQPTRQAHIPIITLYSLFWP